MTRSDWLIVGVGFTGAVLAERIATQLDQNVLVIDRRGHIGGNAFDSEEGGLLVHRYGPHIFHTNSERVLALSQPLHGMAPILSPCARCH